MSLQACYTINRNKNYFRIYWKRDTFDYPLETVQEYKTQHDFTYQQIANALLNMKLDELETER